MTKENYGAEFLHSRNPSLYQSTEAQLAVSYLRNNGEQIGNQPSDVVTAYLGFLGSPEYVNDGLITGDQESTKRQVEAHVVESDQVPDSYFDLQLRIAREAGEGRSRISPEEKDTMTKVLQEDQRRSLGVWGRYLGNQPNSIYPEWFKLYVFDGVPKLGKFDEERGKFVKRTKSTVAPFAELNPEALARVKDSLIAHQNGREIEDKELQKLAAGGNFGKLYAHELMKVTNRKTEQLKDIRGSWVRYDQIEGNYSPDYEQLDNGEFAPGDLVDNPTANKLAESLHEHQTGWCTASYATAAMQLVDGDFYVYYSRDKEGNDTIPRIALRTENGTVVEVSGINPHQALEDELLDTVEGKLVELGQEQYFDRITGMKRLTDIDNRVRAGGELTAEDILWLRYFKIVPMHGDDDFSDPRVRELLSDRNEIEDLRIIAKELGTSEVVKILAKELGKEAFHVPGIILDDQNDYSNLSSLFIDAKKGIDTILELLEPHDVVKAMYDSLQHLPEQSIGLYDAVRRGIEYEIGINFEKLVSESGDKDKLLNILAVNNWPDFSREAAYMLIGNSANGSVDKEIADYMIRINQEDLMLEYLEKFNLPDSLQIRLKAKRDKLTEEMDKEPEDYYGDSYFSDRVEEYYS